MTIKKVAHVNEAELVSIFFPMQIDELAIAIRDTLDGRTLVMTLYRIHLIWVLGTRVQDFERDNWVRR